MYVDAEHQLKELSKDHNQYKDSEDPKSTITAPLGDQAEMAMMDMGMESEMMISDEEIMLVGDDFVVAESDFNKQKEEEINNAFVKIEDDPRITKVGKFIRKTGLWQVEERGRGGAMSAEERKQLDITYGQTYNFLLDMKIILKTFTAFKQKGNV